jgi:hypothetical protein
MNETNKTNELNKKVVKAIWKSAIIGNIVIIILSVLFYYLSNRDILETISTAGLVSLEILIATLCVVLVCVIFVRNEYEKMTLVATIVWSLLLGMSMGVTMITMFNPGTDYIHVNLYGIKGDASAMGIIFNFFFSIMIILPIAAYYQEKFNEQNQKKTENISAQAQTS